MQAQTRTGSRPVEALALGFAEDLLLQLHQLLNLGFEMLDPLHEGTDAAAGNTYAIGHAYSFITTKPQLGRCR